MTWWAIDVRTSPADRAPLGAWLVAHTGQAIEEQADGTLVTFAETEASADELLATLHARDGVQASRRPLEAVDWSTKWRDGIVARRFGRLLVAPTWVEVPAVEGVVQVILDPETAFGSGEHGSTRAALALLERHLVPGMTVLDLGSGSGILAIAAVKLGAARALGVEMDGEANPIAEHNAARNGVAESVEFFEGEAGSFAPLLGPADIVCSNILRTVNTVILPAIEQALVPGGLAIFSGMELQEEALFRPTLESNGWAVVDVATDAGWWACAARVA